MTATTLTRPLVKRTVLTVILILLVTAAVRMPVWSIPFERDEGEYAYIAWRMEHQELPYRDWIDQKPPGIFWVYRFALSLPIEPVHAVRLVALLFSAASACALFLLARRFVEPF
jgi:4-amino-4-deoxy-L-arabinose transferase-like glycosyltransferase